MDIKSFANHEMVVFASDPASGLRAIIAVHSTARGPSAGGVRMRPYASEEDALNDVLRLSEAMTWKNATADLPLGGGKSVIIADPATDKTEALLEAFGKAVERLSGTYWAAEDMGITPQDMAVINRKTQWVAGLPDGEHAGGDPSPVTAQGVFSGIYAALRSLGQASDLGGKTVAVQGLGHVGMSLAGLLHNAGANLIVADVNQERLQKATKAFGARVMDVGTIHTAEADIFAPCAVGGILNDQTLPELRAGIVAGAANNQLARPEHAMGLHERGILYVPDYVVNAGGIINVAAEILRIDDAAVWVANKLHSLEKTLFQILSTAVEEKVSPAVIADRLARSRVLSSH